MGELTRTDFSLGWQPSADAFHCPPNALLRMDNLVLDERGSVSLRRGSAKVNSSIFTRSFIAFDHTSEFEEDYFNPLSGIAQFTAELEREHLPASVPGDGPGNYNHDWELDDEHVTDTTVDTDEDAHSMFTHTLDGTRYRMAAVDDAIYANSAAVWASMDGSGDVAFGAHMGHILFARGETKKKYDGTTVRNWGIAAPSSAPTLTANAADSKVFSTCAQAESPGMTQNEGTQSFTTDKAGTANAAVQIVPDATTARGTSTKTFASAADFTSYDNGQDGSDEDLIELDVYVTEPQYMDRVTLMIDVNDGLFQSDYYVWHFVNGEPVEVALDTGEVLSSDYELEGFERDEVRARLEERGIGTEFRIDKPVSDAGWNHFSVPRGKMRRIGSTSGKNWSTVKAVRVTFVGLAGGSGAAVKFDDIKIIGGAERGLTGKYKAVVVAVRNDGTYTALSAPSAASDEIELKAQGVQAAVNTSGLDYQVNELWLYLMGGRLDGFYRAGVTTGGPFSGSQTIDANTSDIAILTTNLRLGTNLTTPPDDIIGIEGPHFDRTLCLTAELLYPSQQRNPDSFNSREAVRVGDDAETALWIRKVNEQLYVGTTRDIYRIDGDWTVLPNGALNIAKRPLGVSTPPISKAITVGTVQGAETLIYLTSDGWRVLGGPLLTDGAVDLLWAGYTRHGVSPVNISDSASRFRVAITKNVLYALTPEGDDTTETSTLHVYNFIQQRWYRHTYTSSWRSLLAEPDGTLIAGSDDGFVWTLDNATKQDAGSSIPVVLWTGVDDNDEPFTYKNAQNLLIRVDTDSDTATIAFHLDGSDDAATTTTTALATTGTGSVNLFDEDLEFTQVQLRITGSFDTFILRQFALRYLDNPLPLKLHDTGYSDLDGSAIQWVRKIRVKAKSPVDLTVTPYWDGTAGTARTITVGSQVSKVSVFEVPLGREDKGRTARTVITSTSPSHVYWVEYELNGSGKQRSKKPVRVAVT